MQIMELIEIAKTKQVEIQKRKEDWVWQLEQLNDVVKQVKKWQKPLFKKFAEKELWPSRDHYIMVFDKPYIDGVLSRGANRVKLYPGGVAPFKVRGSMWWKGAIIYQWMTRTKQENGDTLVHYEATLDVDENYFLQQMLPVTVALCEPQYTLFSIDVLIPRAELLKESIHSLNKVFE